MKAHRILGGAAIAVTIAIGAMGVVEADWDDDWHGPPVDRGVMGPGMMGPGMGVYPDDGRHQPGMGIYSDSDWHQPGMGMNRHHP